MNATPLLLGVLALTLQRIRRLRRALTTTHGCETSWCCVDLGDGPCTSTISIGGTKTCTEPAGHGGLHAHGGWGWTDGIADTDKEAAA